MMRSLYSGVVGLKNLQTKLDVIGNNIANVNTTGYKKSRVVFEDALYQAIRGASSPTDSSGGTNAMAVGLGMTISSIDQIHTATSTSTTGNLTDLAIDGGGYFIVNDGENTYYTRAGSFNFDSNGNLVNSAGNFVQGWMADDSGTVDTTNSVGNIDISSYQSIAAKASEEVEYSGNLDAGDGVAQVSGADITVTASDQYASDDDSIILSTEVYDSLGNEITVYLRFFKQDTDTWACDISLDPDFEDATGYTPATDFELYDISAGGTSSSTWEILRAYNLEFDTGGEISDPDNAQISLVIDRSAEGADDIELTIDLSEFTQYSSESTASYSQDGYSAGSLSSYSIGIDGTLTGVYDNGQSMDIARVALANFQNPAGLIQTGSSLFQSSTNSGTPVIGAPGEGGTGALIPGSLEMSNVDLAEELTDMIVTQRAFQANSRIITTSDEMLEELVNLKR